MSLQLKPAMLHHEEGGKAVWPVTEVVHCTKGVTGAGQTATGAVGEMSLFTVLTLQTGVARQTWTLTCDWVTLVLSQNAFATGAAVTEALWME